ncbi:MAG: hypothetical protein HW378_180 [Anaerolineales bacterium]|nr:hypothetical protein [Anaerolineales bacterium]
MTEIIKRNAPQWGGFWLAFLSYAVAQTATDVAAWLAQIGEAGWAQMSWYKLATLICQLSLGLALTLRMLQNSSYQDAKQNGNSAAGVAAASP